MSGQFDKETNRQNFEWHRERALREKRKPTSESANRLKYNLKAIAEKHGIKAANEVLKEFHSKKSNKRQDFT